MNSELALLKFINNYTHHNPDENGEKYSEDQANLIETFGNSIGERVPPQKFEKTIIENKMKLKSKRKKSCYVKIPLNPQQVLHFKLLYYIVYLSFVYPDKISKYNFSEDLNELFNNEEKIISLYREIKHVGLN